MRGKSQISRFLAGKDLCKTLGLWALEGLNQKSIPPGGTSGIHDGSAIYIKKERVCELIMNCMNSFCNPNSDKSILVPLTEAVI